MKTRLIDANAFFNEFPELAIEPYINAPTVELDEDIVKEFLNKRKFAVIPAETLIALQLACGKKRPKAKWLPQRVDKRHYYYFCSNCGYRSNYSKGKYCSKCGYEMGGENSGNRQ